MKPQVETVETQTYDQAPDPGPPRRESLYETYTPLMKTPPKYPKGTPERSWRLTNNPSDTGVDYPFERQEAGPSCYNTESGTKMGNHDVLYSLLAAALVKEAYVTVPSPKAALSHAVSQVSKHPVMNPILNAAQKLKKLGNQQLPEQEHQEHHPASEETLQKILSRLPTPEAPEPWHHKALHVALPIAGIMALNALQHGGQKGLGETVREAPGKLRDLLYKKLF